MEAKGRGHFSSTPPKGPKIDLLSWRNSSPWLCKYPCSEATPRAGAQEPSAQQDLFLAAARAGHKQPSVVALATAHSRDRGSGPASKGPIVWLPGPPSWLLDAWSQGRGWPRAEWGLRGRCGSCSPKDAPEATVLLEKENRLHLRSGRRVASDGPQGDTYMHTHTHTTHCRGDKC